MPDRQEVGPEMSRLMDARTCLTTKEKQAKVRQDRLPARKENLQKHRDATMRHTEGSEEKTQAEAMLAEKAISDTVLTPI